MITAIVSDKRRVTSEGVSNIIEYDGLSTDTKPLYDDGARNADIFLEMDTGSAFKFDEDGDKWREL
jgi:hypothetical protein